METLQGQLQRLQNAFSHYKKGEFLDLNLNQTPTVGLILGLGLGLELAGLGSKIELGWDHV